MVQTMGKQGRKVPIILTEEMKRGIEALIRLRDDCCIIGENPYVFASSGKGPVDGWQVLQKMAKEAKCKQPELVTATRLRKYIATCAQVIMTSAKFVQEFCGWYVVWGFFVSEAALSL